MNFIILALAISAKSKDLSALDVQEVYRIYNKKINTCSRVLTRSSLLRNYFKVHAHSLSSWFHIDHGVEGSLGNLPGWPVLHA